MSAVRIENLVKRFGDFVAVNEVSITAEEGRLTTLLGPSGCGKTTTLRMTSGLETPDSGEIWIGDDLVASPSKGINVAPEHRNVGMVFQSYAIWPHKTAFENVAYPLKLRRMSKAQIRQRVEEIFSLLRLEGLEGRYPGQLSGGQQQRVALGRAIVYQSRLLLLDEPLANLDAKVREAVRLELKELQRQLKFTTIYVTHDQAEAMAISDKIVVMDQGVVVQEGTALEIYRTPRTKFVAEFVGQSNFVDGRLVSSNGSLGVVDVGEGIAIEAKVGEAGLDGGTVSLCIRPEDFELSADRPVPGSRGRDWFEGNIRDFTFHGNIINYFVACGAHVLTVQSEAGSQLKFKEADKVYLRVRPNGAIVLS
ncbi:MAG: ABC transporter ATP-binding protein [Defluviicoccus sp.]|nr:ABC transporter ATP-binding protein [Defluviicoccus sp.]MDE0274840.1 ABC transporter ATP-binding protein [Defluviicoccus sp.]